MSSSSASSGMSSSVALVPTPTPAPAPASITSTVASVSTTASATLSAMATSSSSSSSGGPSISASSSSLMSSAFAEAAPSVSAETPFVIMSIPPSTNSRTPPLNGDILFEEEVSYSGEYAFIKGRYMPSGHGILMFAKGLKYTGKFLAGSPVSGLATIEKLGARYDGQCVDLVPHGNGTFVTSAWTYEGAMVLGMIDGSGTVTFKNGAKQTGIWKDRNLVAPAPPVRAVASSSSSSSSARVQEEQIEKMHGVAVPSVDLGDIARAFFPEICVLPKELVDASKQNKNIVIQGVGVYVGQSRAEFPHGTGTCRYTDGSTYVGEWDRGKRHGYGTISEPDGTSWEGLWSEGQKHGFGLSKSGEACEWILFVYGGKVDDRQAGTVRKAGVLRSLIENIQYDSPELGKCSYVGAVHNDKPHGQGRWTFNDKSTYVGESVDGMFQGIGRYVDSKGGVFCGEFFQNNRAGQGTFREGQVVLKGSWVEDDMTGYGYVILSDGGVYQGQLYKNKRHGRGVLCSEEGWVYDGLWRNQEMVNPKNVIRPNATRFTAPPATGEGVWVCREVIEGEVVETGFYIGGALNGKRHGYGANISKDRFTVKEQGEWVHGQLLSVQLGAGTSAASTSSSSSSSSSSTQHARAGSRGTLPSPSSSSSSSSSAHSPRSTEVALTSVVAGTSAASTSSSSSSSSSTQHARAVSDMPLLPASNGSKKVQTHERSVTLFGLPPKPSSSYSPFEGRAYARINYGNGGKYVGEVKDGKPFGWGKLTYATGTIYEGYFDEYPRGRGKVTFTNGLVWEGEVGSYEQSRSIAPLFEGVTRGKQPVKVVYEGSGSIADDPIGFAYERLEYEGFVANSSKKGGGGIDLPSGTGIISYWRGNEPVAKYVGRIEQGVPHGRGTLKHAEGIDLLHYEGDWNRGKRHGEGRQWKVGFETHGIWQNNQLKTTRNQSSSSASVKEEVSTPPMPRSRSSAAMKASGTTPEGHDFEGMMIDGVLNGHVKFTFKGGGTYEGPVINGIPSGPKAKYTFLDGSIYEGVVKDGFPHGLGKWVYKDLGTYRGEFVKGKREGKGTFVWCDGGHSYDGSWRQDCMHGYGVRMLINPTNRRDDSHILGIWTDGCLQNILVKEPVIKNNDLLPDFRGKFKYEGATLNGQPQGKGVLTYRTEIYAGTFHMGNRHGEIVHKVDDLTIKAEWTNDTFDGPVTARLSDGIVVNLRYVKGVLHGHYTQANGEVIRYIKGIKYARSTTSVATWAVLEQQAKSSSSSSSSSVRSSPSASASASAAAAAAAPAKK